MPIQDQSALRSEGLRELISYRPGFLIRWGIPVFFLLLAGLVIGSCFIEYPDIVNANARIHSINPPKQIIAKNGGRVIKLFKKDNSEVEQAEIIGFIESTARHDEVLRLSAILDTLQFFADAGQLEEIPQFWNTINQPFARLGELQQSHQTFMQGYIAFKDYLNSGFYVAKKQMLNRDLNTTKKLLHTLQQQKELQQQDLAITIQDYNVHDTLHNEALITELEYRNRKSQLINKKMSIPQINSSIISNEGQQNALLKEIMELDNMIAQQKAVFIQLLNSYRNTIEEWKHKFLLVAPVSGNLIYASFLTENQQISSGQIIGLVTNASDRYFVEMLIPQTNFGKVKPGQDVLLKFPSFPSQEFGSVKGKIEYIKNVPSDSGYLAKVILPEGLVTNYKKTIVFTEGLLAQAEIITAKRRLSDRLISGFKNLIK